MEEISLFKLICSKNDGLFYLTLASVGQLHLVRETICKIESVKRTEELFCRLH